MIMLYDMLKSVGAYGKHAGLHDGIDMALDKDKEEWFTLRIQSYICPGGDKIELFERLYSYSSLLSFLIVSRYAGTLPKSGFFGQSMGAGSVGGT